MVPQHHDGSGPGSRTRETDVTLVPQNRVKIALRAFIMDTPGPEYRGVVRYELGKPRASTLAYANS